MKKRNLEKRKARSEVILDIDDLNLLAYLFIDPKTGKTHSGLMLDILKEKMNMSHNALLVHLRRLSKWNLITIFRSPQYPKFKLVTITKNGIDVCKELYEAETLASEGKRKIIAKRTNFFGREISEETIIE